MRDRIVCVDVEDGLGAAFDGGADIDAVVHAATNYGRHGESVAQILESNTLFPLAVLEAAIAAQVSTFINTDTVLDRTLNAYAMSKAQFRDWGKWQADQGKICFLNARLEHMYGAGDDASKFTSYVLKSLLSEVEELKLTSGEQRRDFIYIADVLSAYDAMLSHGVDHEPGFQSFDVGTGEAVRVRDFVSLAKELTASTTKLMFGAVPYRPGEAMLSEANTAALESLGWRRKFVLRSGLAETIRLERSAQGHPSNSPQPSGKLS